MKFLTAIAVSLAIFGKVNADCPCDDGKDFILADGKCVDFPKSGETGAIANCELYNYDNGENRWECSSCNVQFHRASDILCEDGGVQNCIYYNKDGSTFECQICAKGFYLDGQTCTGNPDTVANCADYQKNGQDVECSSCKENHYYKSDTKECVAYPSTVTGCDEYEWENNAAECESCSEDYTGLDGQTCYKISEKITDCVSGTLKSSGVYQCFRCSEGKMPEDKGAASDVCVANPTDAASGQVENCQSYRKDAAGTVSCVQCIQHFGLKSDNTCEDVAAGKVENCGEYHLHSGAWDCDDCLSGHYGNTDDHPTSCTKCPETSKNSSASVLSVAISLVLAVVLL